MKLLILGFLAIHSLSAMSYEEFQEKSRASHTKHMYGSCVHRLIHVENYTEVEARKECKELYYPKED